MKKFFSENKDYILNMFLVLGTNAFLYFIVKHFIPSYHLITLPLDDKIPLIPFFIIYPTMVTRLEVNGYNSLVSLMLYITYITDIPVNCFPSLHCTFALLVMYAVTFDKNMNKVFRILVGIISPLICLSTVLVKQHSVIDVVGALFLSCIIYVDFKKRK